MFSFKGSDVFFFNNVCQLVAPSEYFFLCFESVWRYYLTPSVSAKPLMVVLCLYMLVKDFTL